MKIKTSVTLTEELVHNIDLYGQAFKNRSDFIETAVLAFINQIIKDQQNKKDLEIINKNADRLNIEANDVLEFQRNL